MFETFSPQVNRSNLTLSPEWNLKSCETFEDLIREIKSYYVVSQSLSRLMELKKDDACTIQTSSSSSCLRAFFKMTFTKGTLYIDWGFLGLIDVLFKEPQKDTNKILNDKMNYLNHFIISA